MHAITLPSASSDNSAFGKTLARRCAFRAASCCLTAAVNGSSFSNASQETRCTLACVNDDPISSSPGVLAHHPGISSRRSPPGTLLPYTSPHPKGCRPNPKPRGALPANRFLELIIDDPGFAKHAEMKQAVSLLL